MPICGATRQHGICGDVPNGQLNSCRGLADLKPTDVHIHHRRPNRTAYWGRASWLQSACSVSSVYAKQRFSNYGSRTTCGSRDLPLWSFKKIQKKHSNELRIPLKLKMSEFGTCGNRLSLFPSVLKFCEMYYPTHLPTSHSTLSNKRGV